MRERRPRSTHTDTLFPYTTLFRSLVALRSFFGTPEGLPAFNPTDNFRANEKSYAAYAQVKYGFDLGTIVVDGLIGLRAVKTKTRISGFSRIEDTGGVVTFPPITAESDYTDYLPNVSARERKRVG